MLKASLKIKMALNELLECVRHAKVRANCLVNNMIAGGHVSPCMNIRNSQFESQRRHRFLIPSNSTELEYPVFKPLEFERFRNDAGRNHCKEVHAYENQASRSRQ